MIGKEFDEAEFAEQLLTLSEIVWNKAIDTAAEVADRSSHEAAREIRKLKK